MAVSLNNDVSVAHGKVRTASGVIIIIDVVHKVHTQKTTIVWKTEKRSLEPSLHTQMFNSGTHILVTKTIIRQNQKSVSYHYQLSYYINAWIDVCIKPSEKVFINKLTTIIRPTNKVV